MGGLADLLGFPGRDSGGRDVGPGEGIEKMYEAIGTSDTWKTRATVVVAVLVLVVTALVSMLEPVPTADANAPDVHATSTGGRGYAGDSYVERHAEVVAGYRQDGSRW